MVGPDAGFTRRIADEMPTAPTLGTADGRAFAVSKADHGGSDLHPMDGPTGRAASAGLP